MISCSRLLVLVEDTTASRDLWPLWSQKALEPILEKIESAAFGYYELNLVAFASVDGLSDGCVRSGTWTQNVWRFRQYCESLKFEGTGNSNAMCEALVEATYLTRQPSTLGKLENVTQHVLLCTAGSIGRLSVPWPFREHVSHDGDRRVHLLTILGHMVTTRGLSFSILTVGTLNNILPKKFGTLVGSRVLKMCEKLSPQQNYLMLIHPRWRHGYQALFPECKEMEEWIDAAAVSASDSDQNFRTASPSLPLPPHIRPEAALKPLDIHQFPPPMPPSRAAVEQAALSIKTGQEFPDAIRLSSWSKAQDAKLSWNDSTTLHLYHHSDHDLSKMSVDGLSSVESELALERDLLQLESTQTSFRDVSSEKESKVESSTSYGGGVTSPAHSSTKYSALSVDPSSVAIRDPFATNAAQMATVLPEDGASSTQSQRIPIAAQRSKTMSSSASVSIETCRKLDELSSQRRSLPRNGVLVEKRAQTIDHRRSWPSPTTPTEPRNLLDSTRSYPTIDDPLSAYPLSSEIAIGR